MVKGYTDEKMEDVSGFSFQRVSTDPSIERLEQMMLRLIQLIEAQGTITKSGSGEINTLAGNIKKALKKRDKSTGMNLKGSDFMRKC